MSIFASQTQTTIPIPFDQPNTVTIRKLTGREIEEAQEAHRASIATGRARAWAGTFRRMLENGSSDPEVQRALRDPLTGYDRYALVSAGLLSWTYRSRIVIRAEAEHKAADCVARQACIDDLDDEATDFIATEILRLTKPELFQTSEEAEAARKNASGSSTSA